MSELTIQAIRKAMELVDENLPDGAYWAMVHDILGVFPILAEDADDDPASDGEGK